MKRACLAVLMAGACQERGRASGPPAPAPTAGVTLDAAPPAGDAGPECLDEAAVASELRELEETIDAGRPAGAAALGPSELTGSTCGKRVYRRGAYHIVVSRDSHDPGAVRGSFSELGAGATRATARCLANAESELRRLLPYAGTILVSARAASGEQWTDVDLGPATHLECDAQDRPVGGSLGTLVHELNHSLGRGSCVHEPATGSMVCFSLPPGMPPRSLARLDRVRIKDRSLRRAIQAVHTLYLGRLGDGDIVSLIDEMVSYRLTADVYAAELRDPRRSTGAVVNRQLVNLPLIAYFVTRYLVALRTADPALYDRSFGAGAPANRAALLGLLDRTERSYAEWKRALAAAHSAPVESETLYWTLYRAARRRAFAPTRPPRDHDHRPRSRRP